ncbi:FMN-binding protein [Corynebacterium sp. S7]
MKKFILGLGVLSTLVAYSYGIRAQQQPINTAASEPIATSTAPSSATSAAPSSTTSAAPSTTTASSGAYTDGTYTGSAENAVYGTVQVQATITGGNITDVTFLQSPDSRSASVRINQQAMPYLKQEAIAAQDAQVNTVKSAGVVFLPFDKTSSVTTSGTGTSSMLARAHATS